MTQVKVGWLSDIPAGEGRTFAVGDTRVAVFHSRDGHVYATQAECPHKMGRLADGLVGGHHLVCPLHEWTFDLETGEPVNGECGLRVYPVHCGKDGAVVIDVE